ncbi:DUF4430 domain-containing protein [Gracilibacillus kekensis]|uniref:Transcobalamin-like C-terminal domain-containing protein n=1 Tax=Gracilibacillus kekensis TaxID=1027249 RepID=A0A1M7PRY1_9BACI|nr:DUF4430 domain-containing protein [Gracilibacillus kekensis]SHN20122.1 protein of unknown function [Gracilibacillus kekensis]
MKKITQILSIIVLTILLAACGEDEAITEEVNVQITITDQTSDTQISNENITVESETTLLTVLEENYNVEVSEEGFLTAIEGHQQNIEEKHYWMYEINGEMANVGIADYEVKDEDHITFDLKATE